MCARMLILLQKHKDVSFPNASYHVDARASISKLAITIQFSNVWEMYCGLPSNYDIILVANDNWWSAMRKQ